MGSNYPRAMRTAADGGIWIGSFDGGLAHLRDGRWTITDTSSGLPSNRIRGLLETSDPSGKTTLWIATERGVARLQEGRLSVFGEGSGLPSLDTEGLGETTDENGERTLLVGTAYGLARFVHDRFVPVAVPRQILGRRIVDIVESTGLGGRPALWISSYGEGMAVRENGAWTVLDKTSGLPSNVEVITKSQADDGSPALWIGTEGGLLRFEHGRFTLYDERSGLPIRIIWKVLETTAASGLKTLWLGTWGGGVVRLSPNAWVAFDSTNGMPSGSVTSILVTTDAGAETVWAGTSDGELARFDGRRFERVPLPEALRHAIVFSLLETRDPDGQRSLWVGSFGGGVGRLKAGRWSVLDKKELPNPRVYELLETKSKDGASVLWVCTEGGLGRFEGGKWTYFRKGEELPSELVTEALETTRADGTRTLWAATSRGIARLEGGRWSVMGKEAGLAVDNVFSLARATDADGTDWLWAATFGGGASRLRLDDPAARFETFTTESLPALPSDTVMSVAQDHQGGIYLCTTRGIAWLLPRAPTEGDPAPFGVEVFTTDDGLPSGACQQSARHVDGKGRVWAGTARGLAMFDPQGKRPDRGPKPLVVDAALLGDVRRVLRDGDSLSHAERNLSFAFALLAYGAEARIRYRYELVGFDPRPSDWTASSVKEYTNLGAGDYVFRAWGRDARGNVSGPASLGFRVRPAPWMTLWAFAAYGLTLLAAGYASIQWRVRTLARRTKELESVVAERTRDLVAARDRLDRLASVDALTGVANRRAFETTLDTEWKRAQRGGHWLSLVLLDVDFFKLFNDRYGHARGDDCLRAVAQAVAAQCRRPTDLAARYGGEEFALVVPETEPAGVRTLLEGVLAAVDALAIEHVG
ncbi:MAG TPA: diguanylate cyclase, partial [Vicinamibacteria bacterium]